MPVGGQWTVNGSATELHVLSARLRATGQSGLKRNITVAVRTATVPARDAVRAELRATMPKEGGLNEWLAKASVTSTVLTGAKTAGVVIRGTKRGHDLKAANTGIVRHPVYGHRDRWATTDVPAGWWEKALKPFRLPVLVALRLAMKATAKEAGF